MAIKLEKSTLSVNQIIAEKKENIAISGDCIVPDIKPDILEILGTNGIVNVYKREVMDGKVRIDGCVNIYIMYLGDDGNTRGVRSINHNLDFSQIFNIDNANNSMIEEGEVTLNNIECKIINERKINLKANLEFEMNLQANSEVQFVNNVDLKDLQKLENTKQVNSVLGMGNTKTTVKETVNIDNVDNLAEILKVDAHISNKNIKISYNKILIKADLKLKILYSTEDGRINSVNAKFPIMGFIDMQDITEDNIVDYEFEIKNMIIKPNSSAEHSIYVEIEVGISAIAYENKEINIIEDLYSPGTDLKFDKSDIKMIQNKSNCKGTLSINQKEPLDIGEDKVFDVETRINLDEIKVNNGEVILNGNIDLNFIHSPNGINGLQMKKLDIPFEHRIQCNSITKDSNVKVRPDIITSDFTMLPGEVNIKLDIDFYIDSSNNVTLNLINNVEEENSNKQDDYNMVIYTTRKGDNLWNIAKTFKSTINNIVDTNDIKDEKITPGMQLFIEKYMG